MMSFLRCLVREHDLPRKGMSVLEKSWDSYSKKCLTRSRQYDLLKVQLLFREIREHPASIGHPVNACHDCRFSVYHGMCRRKAAMLAEADYVRRRLKILRQKKIQEAEDLLRGPAIMLGDIVQSCISPLAPAEEVWSQLLVQQKKDN